MSVTKNTINILLFFTISSSRSSLVKNINNHQDLLRIMHLTMLKDKKMHVFSDMTSSYRLPYPINIKNKQFLHFNTNKIGRNHLFQFKQPRKSYQDYQQNVERRKRNMYYNIYTKYPINHHGLIFKMKPVILPANHIRFKINTLPTVHNFVAPYLTISPTGLNFHSTNTKYSSISPIQQPPRQNNNIPTTESSFFNNIKPISNISYSKSIRDPFSWQYPTNQWIPMSHNLKTPIELYNDTLMTTIMSIPSITYPNNTTTNNYNHIISDYFPLSQRYKTTTSIIPTNTQSSTIKKVQSPVSNYSINHPSVIDTTILISHESNNSTPIPTIKNVQIPLSNNIINQSINQSVIDTNILITHNSNNQTPVPHYQEKTTIISNTIKALPTTNFTSKRKKILKVKVKKNSKHLIASSRDSNDTTPIFSNPKIVNLKLYTPRTNFRNPYNNEKYEAVINKNLESHPAVKLTSTIATIKYVKRKTTKKYTTHSTPTKSNKQSTTPRPSRRKNLLNLELKIVTNEPIRTIINNTNYHKNKININENVDISTTPIHHVSKNKYVKPERNSESAIMKIHKLCINCPNKSIEKIRSTTVMINNNKDTNYNSIPELPIETYFKKVSTFD